MAMSENKQKMLRGELYVAFTPELSEARARCSKACKRFNTTEDMSRRKMVELWREIVQDTRPLPPQAATEEEDAKLFKNEPYILAPVCADYGFNVSLGEGAFLNFNALFLDTCKITIGARTLVGPNVSFFAATHPLDPVVRQGLKGPEGGKPITIGEDCWIGGNVTILPGVTIGRGATIGAGSVVSKNVPAFHVAAGNPAKVIRKIETAMDPEQSGSDWKGWPEDHTEGAENPMSKME